MEAVANVLILTADKLPSGLLPEGTLLLRHRRVPWRATAVIPLVPEDHTVSVLRKLAGAGVLLTRAAHARIQDGLDMWEAKGEQLPSLTVYGYVTSDPETRAEYYESQYRASAPAMRELWEAGHVQRFVGLEIIEDFVPTRQATWDVLHVTSIAVGRIPFMLRWTSHFDAHARAAGYPSTEALKARWDEQRTKKQGMAMARVIRESEFGRQR